MTPKSLWMILIRIFGLYAVFQGICMIPNFITSIIYAFRMSVDEKLSAGAIFVLVLSFYAAIMRYCIFRPQRIITLLNLDKGFDEEQFGFNAGRIKWLNIGVNLIGGYLIVTNFPSLCRDMFIYIQKINSYNYFKDFPQSVWIVYYFVSFMTGCLLIAYNRGIARFIIERSEPGEDLTPDNNA